jgi:hypothetical protein
MVTTKKGNGRVKGAMAQADKNSKRAAEKHAKKKVKHVTKKQAEEEEEEEAEELETEGDGEMEEEEEEDDVHSSDSESSACKRQVQKLEHKDKVADRKRAIEAEETEMKILDKRLAAQQKINVQRHHDLREKRNSFPDDREVIDMFL